MRVGLNLLYLIPGVVGGTETYAAGLLHGLATVAPDDEFVVFVNREAEDWPLPIAPNFVRVVCPVTASSRVQRYYFEQVGLPTFLRKYQVDLVHSLGYVGPVICPCPSVLTIHDLNYVDLARTIPLYRRLPLRLVSTLAARNAAKVITVSNFSKERLCQRLKLSGDKVKVIYEAPHPKIISPTTSYWPDLARQYGIPDRYIVAFGGRTTHKNIPALLQAFALVSKTIPHNLVLIGQMPPNVNVAAFGQRNNLQGRIIATGYVRDTHIFPLLSHAELFVLPSLYEGFGLPVLEAQQAGVPVACSIAGSLPEIAGDGAVFFDPKSVESIAETMIRCLSRPELREELLRRGQENLRRFSWRKTAADTMKVYRMLATES